MIENRDTVLLVRPVSLRHPGDVSLLRDTLSLYGYVAVDRDIEDAWRDYCLGEREEPWVSPSNYVQPEILRILLKRLVAS